MSRRVYKHCNREGCNRLVLVYGEPKKGDFKCVHRFSRAPMTPTVIYENAAGEQWVPPDPNAGCPLKGYQRREIQPHEVRKFEREQNAKLKAEYEAERMKEYDPEGDAIREQIRREMQQEVLRESEGWDREHRELLDYAIQEQRDTQSGYTRNYDPNFRISEYS